MSVHRNTLFEVTSPKTNETCWSRQLCQQRESLPPLSSIFSHATHRPLPTHFGRPSPPSFRSPPEEVWLPAAPFEVVRFPHSPQHERRFSYDARTATLEKIDVTPPTASQKTISPINTAHSRLRESAFVPTMYPSAAYQSPLSNQPNHSEFRMRETTAPWNPLSDNFISPQNNSRLDLPTYAEPQSSSVILNYPPTPTILGDPATTTTSTPIVTETSIIGRDGLGPKIWTGTHFLPRFVRQADVPGEGICYFYDDGTHCKAVIDGEVVNAHWGVTKAGKPRKRLAIACITCREKKIKCDPDYPRCLQCQKFGRVCRFKNAPRGGHSTPNTPPTEAEEIHLRHESPQGDDSSNDKEKASSVVSPCQHQRHVTPDSGSHRFKRRRINPYDSTLTNLKTSPITSIPEAAPLTTTPTDTLTLDPRLFQQLQMNPYNSRPDIMTDWIPIFFRCVPETAHSMFIQESFEKWAFSKKEKSLDEHTTLYAMLCLASVFVSKTEQKPLGEFYASVARLGCENRPFSIHLVQSRLFLALYYFAHNQLEMAWEFCGSAMRVASGLKLNLEIEQSDDSCLQSFPYGLNRAGYSECRRRTFWSTYLMDKFNGFCSGYLGVFKSEDVFLRLPCDTNSFNSQSDARAPFFDLTATSIPSADSSVGSMAYLINIATVWSDVLAQIYRFSQRSVPSSPATFIKFYEDATYRMRAWNASLPDHYKLTIENLEFASIKGELGTLVLAHSVYHSAGMKLNRYIPHSILSKAQVAHHVAVATEHAEDYLHLMNKLETVRRLVQKQEDLDHLPPRFTSPFAGYCIVTAIDILAAKVPLKKIEERLVLFQGSQSVLSDICCFWQSSNAQKLSVQQRVRELVQLSQGEASSNSECFSLGGPIDKLLSRKGDCLYL
ncbi:BgTH12-07476 [Blumeria graminis f. sp. triticale]|uniref:Bgt-5354 n=3 Tax=Blumeria graminis TaxID=34373 RepID=A0A061HK87_BLUGR|nr:hypothetical protein BGT96224_5354 [Blumeria graminis f. sp. tritici 96224]CAD6500296.1 BgTH12-07476 [Blumeria graminis f. sp. triticale]VCU40543.1 Bgt-5354 [Blumeria graminis f. sp. tritici]